MEKVLEYIEKNQDRFVRELVEFLRFPSISGDIAYKTDVSRCADYLKEKLSSLGFKAERFETESHPIIYGSWIRPGNRRTLLLYGHYDVQPVDPLELWNHPPFEPHIENGRIYARGAADDKGQVMAHLCAIQAFFETRGSLPVNLKVLIEGDEENAAEGLDRFVRENAAVLHADGVVVSDSAMFDEKTAAITYGLRGIAAAEIRFEGPEVDLHSGSYGGSVLNPALELARLVARFHDSKGRVAIEGFYDQVRPLDPRERENLSALPFDEEAYRKSIGVPALWGEEGYTALERRSARPTCEVNGIFGGYSGEGAKTIIPSWAGCKITMRLVPDQEPDKILDLFERFVKTTASPAVKVEVRRGGGARPALLSTDSFLVDAGSAAFEAGFGKSPYFIREGGSIPIVNVFKEVLGLDTLLMGFAQADDNAHAPNECFSLESFQKAVNTSAHLYELVK